MKKVAVLVADNYQVLEVWYPYFRLREAGMKTLLVGPEKREYKSKEGYTAQAEISIKDAGKEGFDAVVIPGGYAPDILRRYGDINSFVKAMSDSGRLVAAICHAGWVLVSAGVLKGKRATCFSAIKDDVINAGAKYSDEEVVVDSNLITSRKPEDLPAFCAKIIDFMQKEG